MLLMTLALLAGALQEPAQDELPLTTEQLARAGEVIGLPFESDELDLMLQDVCDQLEQFDQLRAVSLANADLPALAMSATPPGVHVRAVSLPQAQLALPEVTRPADLGQLYFADILTLAALVRAREVSCVELAELFLARLRALDPHLHCVISYTQERALSQARALDEELASGSWRGPLHGIPWGAKDLLAARGARTTWGATPFKDQVLDLDASIVRSLDEAGAVLIAKLSLGALAWGDVWFDATTRNPWSLAQGSSGSSAGSAAAVAAGGVPFAIGSETLGSLVSPSTRCGVSSLRPTFGRVSRHGAMTLCWSLDKLGPMCRSARDVATVFGAIVGPDGLDPTVVERPFAWPGEVDVQGWRVGYPAGAFGEQPLESPLLQGLAQLGVELTEVQLPDYPTGAMLIILGAEAATAFDEFSRSGTDDQLVRQVRFAWPNVLRAARLVPAVEYLRAQRVRVQLMRDWDAALAGVDVLVHPSFAGDILGATNLTGHPTFVCPSGLQDGRDGVPVPTSISFTGHLFDEGRLLALAHRWQQVSGHHELRPPMEFLSEASDDSDR